jgi:hypothetical protein
MPDDNGAGPNNKRRPSIEEDPVRRRLTMDDAAPGQNVWNIDVFYFAARFRSCWLAPAPQTAWVHALLALTVAGGSGICDEYVRIDTKLTRRDAELAGCKSAPTGLACPQVLSYRYFEQLVLRMTARHGQDLYNRGVKRR